MRGVRPDRSPWRVVTRVWVLNLALTGLAVVLAVVAALAGPVGRADVRLPAAVLVALFALAEVLVVHVRFRNDSHTFSMSEAVLVLGLVAATPLQLLAAQAVGAGLVLVVHRRQPPVKLVFNLAQLTIGTSLAVVVAGSLIRHGDPAAPGSWATLVAAAVVAALVNLAAVSVVLWTVSGAVSMRDQLLATPFALANALAASSIGLLAVVLLADHAYAALLLVVPAASVYATNVAFVVQRDKHHRLELIHEATKLLNRAPQGEHGLTAVLALVREQLRADLVALVHRSGAHGVTQPDDADHAVVTLVTHDQQLLMHRVDPLELGPGWWERLRDPHHRPTAPPTFLGQPLDEAIEAPMEGETGRLGIVVVGRYERSVNAFARHDGRIVETLAGHLALTIENGQLERSLDHLRRLERDLGHRATHDALTDLANRALFTERVMQGVADPDQRVGVMFIDLDDFKAINDTLGHAAGDRMLRETADRLRTVVGHRGMPARLGGDEFAVLLEGDVTATAARELADAILATLRLPLQLDGREHGIAATIGVALEHEVADGDELLRNADIAMYVAKAAGKGCHRLFHPRMHDVLLQRQDLAVRLGGAHDRGELVLHYQPIVQLPSGSPIGAEALVRWDHPLHGLLLPDAFVALAEQTGRIGDLTRHVLEAACREAAGWGARPGAPDEATVSVNLTPHDLRNPRLPATIERALAGAGLSPRRLVLEVTEQACHDEQEAAGALARLRELGVRVALDGFGTGASSLSLLRSLPLDVVKLAGPLVRHVHHGGRDADVVGAVLQLTRVLGIEAVAEGVETAAQAEALLRLGFTSAQGYHFAVPSAPDELWAGEPGDQDGSRPTAKMRLNVNR